MQKTIYSKSSIERKDEYKIITRIFWEDGKKQVEKLAQNEKAIAHVENMAIFAAKNPYLTESVVLVSCEKKEKGRVVFPYIEGMRLDQQIDEHAKLKQWDMVYQDVALLKDIIMNVESKYSFQSCGEFEEMFGKHSVLDGYEAATGINIDMVAPNIIVADKIYIIDYEWNFDFLIPLKFILYRSILLNGTINILPIEIKTKIMELVDISQTEEKVFYEMEVAFQKFISGVSLNNLYDEMPIKNYRIDTNELCNTVYTAKVMNSQNITVCQKIYNIQDKAKIIIDMTEQKEKKIHVELADKPAIIKEIEVVGVRNEKFQNLDFTTNSDMFLYDQNYFQNIPCLEIITENYDSIEISYKVQKLEQDGNGYIGTFIKSVRDDRELQLIKNGKAWKMVMFAKKLFGKK